jgi:asparagine synthase (glutamine-hydrolysing)
VLARDAFGIKPLFWSAAGTRVAFASELTALARLPAFSRELDPDAVEAFVAALPVLGRAGAGVAVGS